MEQLFSRFPHLSEAICDQLNNESFGKFKEVNRSWNMYVTEQKFYEVRIIKANIAQFPQIGNGWKEVFKKSSNETLMNLKHALREFLGKYRYREIEGLSPLHVLAGVGPLILFETIFNKIQEKHPKDSWGRTPLHYAALFGNLEMCAFIVTKIDDKNPKDNHGWTPLHTAAYNGHLDICKHIMQKIVDDKNPTTKNGFTPLH